LRIIVAPHLAEMIGAINLDAADSMSAVRHVDCSTDVAGATKEIHMSTENIKDGKIEAGGQGSQGGSQGGQGGSQGGSQKQGGQGGSQGDTNKQGGTQNDKNKQDSQGGSGGQSGGQGNR
jgi:hypothetical protein